MQNFKKSINSTYTLSVDFRNPMNEFVKSIKNYKFIKDCKLFLIGADKIPTVDITLTDGDVLTVDLSSKGFVWVDFNMEKLLGKNPKQAAEKFKQLLNSGAYATKLEKGFE